MRAIEERLRESKESIAQQRTLQAELLRSKRAYEAKLNAEIQRFLGRITSIEAEINKMEVQFEEQRAHFAHEQAKATVFERHHIDREKALKKSYLETEREEMQEEHVARVSSKRSD